MSMGAGLCIPPMMFHPGTQHMYHAPIPHFSPMGVGMGMSMSFGNINGGSPQCPIFPVPSIQRARFPSSALGLTNLQGIPGPNLPIHGHPSPGLHTRVPRAPLVPLTGRHQISAVDSSALRVSSHNEVPRTSSNLNSEDRITNKNSRSMHNAEASSSIDHTSNQVGARSFNYISRFSHILRYEVLGSAVLSRMRLVEFENIRDNAWNCLPFSFAFITLNSKDACFFLAHFNFFPFFPLKYLLCLFFVVFHLVLSFSFTGQWGCSINMWKRKLYIENVVKNI